jgi:S1-C subfamily serine protease
MKPPRVGHAVFAIARSALLGLALISLTLPCRADLVAVIAKAKSSVVAVGTYNPLDSPRFGFRGTGFVVGDGNMLITNAHVLPDAPGERGVSSVAIRIDVGSGRFEVRPASVAALDRSRDLVLLRFAGSALPALQFEDDNNIHEGLSIAIIGFPIGGVLGFTPVTHRGIISAMTAIAMPTTSAHVLDDKTVHRLREGSFDIYQLDATAYPGNSGGPVLDAETGAVVGIINMVLVKGTKESALSQPTGISYAIPARFADELVRRK